MPIPEFVFCNDISTKRIEGKFKRAADKLPQTMIHSDLTTKCSSITQSNSLQASQLQLITESSILLLMVYINFFEIHWCVLIEDGAVA